MVKRRVQSNPSVKLTQKLPAGQEGVVAKIETEDAEPELEQTITSTPRNNVGQGMHDEPMGGVFIDETGMEAQRRRPRLQIAANDKGKGLMEEESELESSDSDEDVPTRLARISRNHGRVLRQHARVMERNGSGLVLPVKRRHKRCVHRPSKRCHNRT